MGFGLDTAITGDVDFEPLLGINAEDIKLLNRAGVAWDVAADNLHKQAVNHVMRRLSPHVNPADVTNTDDAKQYVITWVAERIFRQHFFIGGDPRSLERADFFAGNLDTLWTWFYESITLDIDDDGTADVRLAASLPIVFNRDTAGRFPGNDGRGVGFLPGTRGAQDGVIDDPGQPTERT